MEAACTFVKFKFQKNIFFLVRSSAAGEPVRASASFYMHVVDHSLDYHPDILPRLHLEAKRSTRGKSGWYCKNAKNSNSGTLIAYISVTVCGRKLNFVFFSYPVITLSTHTTYAPPRNTFDLSQWNLNPWVEDRGVSAPRFRNLGVPQKWESVSGTPARVFSFHSCAITLVTVNFELSSSVAC